MQFRQDTEGISKSLMMINDIMNPNVAAKTVPYCAAVVEPKQCTGVIEIKNNCEDNLCTSKGGLH